MTLKLTYDGYPKAFSILLLIIIIIIIIIIVVVINSITHSISLKKCFKWHFKIYPAQRFRVYFMFFEEILYLMLIKAMFI